jgi:hypothetical protein
MRQAELSPDQGTVTIRIPLAMRRHGGRKQVISPAGAAEWGRRTAQIDSTLVKALARVPLAEASGRCAYSTLRTWPPPNGSAPRSEPGVTAHAARAGHG